MLSTIIIGGGPGGLGPLIWAAQAGLLPSWLARGVGIVDRQPRLGGTLGRYAINSDSLGGAYLEFLEAPGTPEKLRELQSDPLTQEMELYRDGFPPLLLVDRFMRRLGQALEQCLALHLSCTLQRCTTALSLHLRGDDAVEVHTQDFAGNRGVIEGRTAIVALGGRQIWHGTLLPQGFTLRDCRPRHIEPSDQLMTPEGLADATAALLANPGRPIVILGGSHSAYAAAWTLTNLLPAPLIDGRRILILQRREPRVFYPSRAEARADGYVVDAGDICPRTQRVNRLGGLRGDGRDMWRRVAGRPGAAAERRISVLALSEYSESALRRLLEDAAMVVPAFGYRSATLPIFDEAGRRLALNADAGGRNVAQDCRLLLDDGRTLHNVFGIGLGTGYRPCGDMGGEPNFDGQANSLWLYQNDIGAVIHGGITECLGEVTAFAAAAPVTALSAAE
jgi:hypothetical protein